jgi:hypothetical protein
LIAETPEEEFARKQKEKEIISVRKKGDFILKAA